MQWALRMTDVLACLGARGAPEQFQGGLVRQAVPFFAFTDLSDQTRFLPSPYRRAEPGRRGRGCLRTVAANCPASVLERLPSRSEACGRRASGRFWATLAKFNATIHCRHADRRRDSHAPRGTRREWQGDPLVPSSRADVISQQSPERFETVRLHFTPHCHWQNGLRRGECNCLPVAVQNQPIVLFSSRLIKCLHHGHCVRVTEVFFSFLLMHCARRRESGCLAWFCLKVLRCQRPAQYAMQEAMVARKGSAPST